MAQTRKKRRTKHRGNAAGMVEVRGRTSRPPSPEERKRQAKEQARTERILRPPSWRTAVRNGALMAPVIFVLMLLTNKARHGSVVPAALLIALVAFVLYVPGGFYLEKFVWQRRMNKLAASAAERRR